MNFIMVNYTNKYEKENLIKYYEDTKKRQALTIKRIRQVYNNAKIHIVTDSLDDINYDVNYHYMPEIEKNNYSKLLIFGLLKEPAIYLDNDVILLRKFTEEELPFDYPFNLYAKYQEEDTKKVLEQGLGEGYHHYNTGVVWIPKPSKKITDELMLLRDRFNIYNNGWTNDEYPISFYVHAHGFKMFESEKVNRYRNLVSKISDEQSIHYTGKEYKKLFLKEYAQICQPSFL